MKKFIFIMPLMAISLLASCNQKTYYTVSFDTTGGSSVAPQKIEEGKTATKPDNPTKENYCFKEWLLDDERFDFNTPIHQNITLTATWDYDDNCPYLTFNAEENSSLNYIAVGIANPDFYYSNDMKEWTKWDVNSSIEIKKGSKIYVKNDDSFLSINYDHYVQFQMTGKIAASGDISSLINGATDKVDDYGYTNLFKDCDVLVRAPKLPATQIGVRSYDSMFANCSNLIEAPDLPATKITDWSYVYMFYNCTNLTKAPNLPAEELGDGSYSNMFEGCENLKRPPIISATQLGSYCCNKMFRKCSKLEEAPELLAKTTAPNCYRDMFYGCDALVEGPALNATQLEEWCYAGMFLHCQNLVTAPYLPAATSNLNDWCYRDMFNDCPKLQKVEVGFGTESSPEWPTTANTYTYEWLKDAGTKATNPTFYWRGTDNVVERTNNTVPNGWSIQTLTR